MAHSSSTAFPLGIDNRIFFQDIHLDTIEAWNTYQQELLAAESIHIDVEDPDPDDVASKLQHYINARNILEEADADYMGAWLLNLCCNQLLAIFGVVNSLEKKTILINQEEEPDELINYDYTYDSEGNIVYTQETVPLEEGMVWIG